MRIFLSLGLLATLFFTQDLNAQSGLPQIPSDAFLVSRISGSSLQSKMSIADMDKLPVFQGMFKEFRGAEVNSLNDIGLDLSKDAYLFAQNTDSVTFFTWMMSISDLPRFKQTCFKDMGIAMDAVSPYSNQDVTMHWSDKALVMVFGMVNDNYTQMNAERLKLQYDLSDAGQQGEYLYEDYDVAMEVPEIVMEEEVYEVPEPVEEVYIENVMVEEPDYPVEELEVPEVVEEYDYPVEEQVEIEDYTEYEVAPEYDPYSSDEYNSYDPYGFYGYGGLGYSEKNQLGQLWRNAYAAQLMTRTGGPVLGTDPGHVKVRASKADASAYFDYGAYMDIMMNEFMGAGGMGMGPYQASMLQMMQMTKGTTVFSELEFNEDEVVWDMTYRAEGEMGKYQADLLDSKLSSDYLKYMNSDELIGYYSLSFNTEAMLEYYEEIIGMYAGGAARQAEAGEASAELLDLLIDEEAVAELFPGSMVVTISDLSKRMVEYVTYEYDDNWNMTEVKGEKEETIPVFLGMMETHRPELVNKLLRIAASQSGEKIIPTEFGYRIDDAPFPMYVMLKGDMLFIGNDLPQAEAIHKGNFKAGLNGTHKKALKSNNTVLFFDAEALVEDVEAAFPNGEFAEQLAMVQGKAEQVMITAKKSGSNSSTMQAVIDVPDGEVNGWTYMMNLLNTFYEYETGR